MNNEQLFPKMRQVLTVEDLGKVNLGNVMPIPDGPIANWNPMEIAVCRLPPNDRDLLSNIAPSHLIVSKKLKNLLSTFVAKRVQFLPIRVQSVDGEIEYPGFSILHALNIWAFWEAKEFAQDYDLFFVPSRDVHITRKLRDAIIATDSVGVEFLEV